MSNEIMLQVKEIDKSFGSTHALNKVSISFYGGQVHGLVGENGSGKSTLSNIIAGVFPPDTGSMELRSEPYAPGNMLEADRRKVSMIVQEMATIDNLSVAANLYAGKEKNFSRYGVVNRRAMINAARKALERIGVSNIDPALSINLLSFEQRKLVELARAVENEPDVLIVDETTTALSQQGRDIMYAVMKEMRDCGKSIIFISHDLDEIMEQCDAVSILRDGLLIKELSRGEMSPHSIRTHMIGREINEDYYRSDHSPGYLDEVVLRVEDLCYANTVQDVSFELHRGEILGIGGLTESGMHELGKVIFGLAKQHKGTVRLEGGPEIDSPKTAIQNQIGYVSKNRDQEALTLTLSIKQNICLPSLNNLRSGPMIQPKAEKVLADDVADLLGIKMQSINQHCSYLSGGNKQKVVLGKWIGNGSQIFVLDCPTRGIDIGVKEAVYRLMMELKAKGKSIIMISEEMPELLGMSDTIIIMKNGAISARLDRCQDLTEHEIIQHMI